MVKLIIGDECGLVKLVRLERETVQKWHTQSRSNGIRCLTWSGNKMSLHGAESTVSAALACGIIRTWDASTMDRTHDTRNAPKDSVHLSTVGSHHMVLAAKGGSVRVFAKDAPSAADEDCDWLATSEHTMPDISAAATASHGKGCLVAAGGRDSLLRVWDIGASSASAASGTPIFEARRQHSDWLHRSVPVWVSGIAFLGVRGPTPEGALPPMTMAALEARYDSDTDDSGDDEDRRESVKALAQKAIRALRGEESAAEGTGKPAGARRKGTTGRWSHFAPAVGRQRLRLESEDETTPAEGSAAGAASSAPASASMPASDDAGGSTIGSTEEELEPWSVDTETFPPAPSAVYEHLTDAEIKETMLRGAVLKAPGTRLPARDNDWRPTAGAPSSVILTVSRHRHVAIYDTRARRQAVMHKEAVGDWALTSCAADPLSYCAYVGDSVGNVSRLELRRNLRTVQRYHGNAGTITSIQMHETMPLLATTGLDRCMRVFHAETGEMVRRVYLKQRLSGCLFSGERRVKKPDYRREYDAQTDKLGLVVRVSCLKGGWRDGIQGKRYRTRPREGEEDEPVEDDGVTEAELEAAGVGAGADQAGGQRQIRARKAGGGDASDDDDEDDDAVWARLDKAAEAPENDEDDQDGEEDDDDASDGSDFDEELEADAYAAAAASATAGSGKHGRDEADAGAGERGDEGAGTESGGPGGGGAKSAAAKRAKPAAASGYDSLGEDSIDDDEDDEDDDSSGDEDGGDDEDGTAHMRRLKHGDADMELVDDPKALKNARKEAVRGRKNEEKASRARQLEQRRQERGANTSSSSSSSRGRGGGRGARRGGRGRRR